LVKKLDTGDSRTVNMFAKGGGIQHHLSLISKFYLATPCGCKHQAPKYLPMSLISRLPFGVAISFLYIEVRVFRPKPSNPR
jgi:hypothetical protein